MSNHASLIAVVTGRCLDPGLAFVLQLAGLFLQAKMKFCLIVALLLGVVEMKSVDTDSEKTSVKSRFWNQSTSYHLHIRTVACICNKQSFQNNVFFLLLLTFTSQLHLQFCPHDELDHYLGSLFGSVQLVIHGHLSGSVQIVIQSQCVTQSQSQLSGPVFLLSPTILRTALHYTLCNLFFHSTWPQLYRVQVNLMHAFIKSAVSSSDTKHYNLPLPV